MKFRLTRLGLALFGFAATLSALTAIFFNLIVGILAISPFVNANSTSDCPTRPTREMPTAGPRITIPRPTIAPPPTPGPPQRTEPRLYPTLVHPLNSKKQALRHLLEYDTGLASWDDPWCVETLRIEPRRIRMKSYSSEFAYTGVKKPPAYRDPGPIWVVTIKGEVHYSIPCMSCKRPPHAYGLRYFIAKDTGMVVGIGGLPQEQE